MIAATSDRGFVIIYILLLIFVLALAGAIALASFDTGSLSRPAAGVSAEAVYKAITGDPNMGTLGYLGDVGDYPANLADLLQVPSPAPAGWNGPYLENVIFDNSRLLDPYGSPLEYFLSLGTGSLDRIAIVSRGPDRSSSNGAANPNIASSAAPFPGSVAYPTASGNSDNVIYPDFIADSSSVFFQNAGSLAYDITTGDLNPAHRAVVPACPGLYTLNVTSATRASADRLALQYSPGLRSVFGQGSYDVSISSALASGTIYSERVDIAGGANVVRDVLLSVPFDSDVTPTFNLTVVNNTSVSLQVRPFDGSTAFTVTAAERSDSGAVEACQSVTVRTSGGTVYDTFYMPYGTYTRYVGPGTTPLSYTLTVTNGGTQSDQLKVIQLTGLLLGTVYERKTAAIAVPVHGALNGSPPAAGVVVNIVKRDGTALSPAVSVTVTGNQTVNVP